MAGKQKEEHATQNQAKELIYVQDYLSFYSDLDTIHKTHMAITYSGKYKTLEEWVELEKAYK